VSGDPNQDSNSSNDRLYGYGRNAFVGPDYMTLDLRLTRKIHFGERHRLELSAESFNLFNRTNAHYTLTDDGAQNGAGQFVTLNARAGGMYYPAYYQQSTSFMQATSAYAPRQVQLSLRFSY
jgi:hypothetical protein